MTNKKSGLCIDTLALSSKYTLNPLASTQQLCTNSIKPVCAKMSR